MICRLMRIFLLTALLVLSHHSYAADAYGDYLADLHLHESRQARDPNQVIRYSDGENGALLQSVLEPMRVKAMMNYYWESKKQGKEIPNVLKLLEPLVDRYDRAFRKNSGAYEREYLDSLDVSFEAITMTLAIMTNSSLAPPATAKESGADAEQLKALADSVQSIVKSMRDLIAFASKAIVTEIRIRVTKGMFSEIGAKRALAIADRVSPQ